MSAETDVVRALMLVRRETGVPITHMLSGSRSPAVSRARALTAYLAVAALNHRRSRVAAAMGLHPTSVAAACASVEDSRTDPETDALLSRVEAELRTVPSPGHLCPRCEEASGVLSTRGHRRRRICLSCGHRWSTLEWPTTAG